MHKDQIRNPQSLPASRLRHARHRKAQPKRTGSRRWQAGAIRNAIQEVMIRGDITDRAFSSPLEWALYACSKIYQMAVAVRVRLYERGVLRSERLPCKVISIGNITVGGTGKTPMAHYVANLLKGLGLEVAIISRGYGGYAQHAGGIVSDGNKIVMGPRASGDEPHLLASKLRGIPVLVGRDRYQAGRLAISRFRSSVLVLDDAFQYLSLRRGLNLLLLDSRHPLGNGYCIPRGTLREPVEHMKRASALVLTRWTNEGDLAQVNSMLEAHARGRPIFRCTHMADSLFVTGQRGTLGLSLLKRRRLFLFSGIARNDSFRETISGHEGDIAGCLEFPDHHRYSQHDLRLIWKRARELNVENIITTEKDYVNILTEIPLVPQLMVLTISISFGDDRDAFGEYIKAWISS